MIFQNTPYYPIKIFNGTWPNVFCIKSFSSAFLWSYDLREDSSKSNLNFSINAVCKSLDLVNKSAWFNDTSAPGIGTEPYLPLMNAKLSAARANVYSNTQYLPGALI